MKVVVLAGGRGLRLREETDSRPKPMVEVGGRPLLWHIIKHCFHHGLDEFIIAAGYRGGMIRDYFGGGQTAYRVEVVDTGLETANGGRLKRLAPMLDSGTFMMVWGDAVSNIDLPAMLACHQKFGRLATIAAVHPPPRFGRLSLEGGRVSDFSEKQTETDLWINGGYFVLEPAVVDYVDGDDTPWEGTPMQRLLREGELAAYRHEGFWQCMDSVGERDLLNTLWESGRPPWRVWED